MIIAIDGPAASGKSTVARRVAAKLGFRYIDTGAMYRAVTYLALVNGVKCDNPQELARLAAGLKLQAAERPAAFAEFIVNGVDLAAEIRRPEVDGKVSLVSSWPDVRRVMVERQRRLAAGRAVVEGRDIGTVVFPDAEVKVFLTASEAERARRRARQFNGPAEKVADDEIRESIRRRDNLDSKRRHSPLVKAADAVEIDTTNLTIDQVTAAIVKLAENAV